MPEKYMLFDVDGVLCRGKYTISDEMMNAILQAEAQGHRYAIVTGGTYSNFVKKHCKTDLFDVFMAHMDTGFFCLGHEVVLPYTGHVFKEDTIYHPPEVTRFFHKIWMFERQYAPFSYERFDECFEERPGMLNFSLIHRNAPDEIKNQFSTSGWRETICEKWYRNPTGNTQFLVGGLTSIDITYAGKECVLDNLILRVKNEVKMNDVMFFGDRCAKYGNDERLAGMLKSMGGTVINVDHPGNTYDTVCSLTGFKPEEINFSKMSYI